MNRFVSFSTSPAYVQQYNEVQKQMKEMLDNKNKAQHVHFEEPVTEPPTPTQVTSTPTQPEPTPTQPEPIKENYCDEHFHSVSVAVIIIILVIFLAFIIQLFSGSVKIKPVEPPLDDDEIY